MPREELFAGWRLFFGQLAAVGPVVLLVQDAQCADAGLLDFLDYLTGWTRERRCSWWCWPAWSRGRAGLGAGPGRITPAPDPLDAAW